MKRVCVVVASRANYGRVKYLMRAIDSHPDLELVLIVGASTLLQRFGPAIDVIRNDGFEPVRSIYYVVEGETLATQAKSTGLGIVELSTAFQDLNLDFVVTVADRFETMATAIAATYLNIPLLHIQGGEVSGNIDDRVRHAITKLADYHFVSSELSKERVIGMGEDPSKVFNFGCPSMDVLRHSDLSMNAGKLQGYLGVGTAIDWSKPYILVLQHAVTTSYGEGFGQMTATLDAVSRFKDIQKIVMWPNVDAGSDDVSKAIRHFREQHLDDRIYYYKNFSPEDYAIVLNNATCAVGNSSSFIREGTYLGVPAVVVGDRQQGREHGPNVKLADYNADSIAGLIEEQIRHGRYLSSKLFGSGDAGARIAEKIADL